MYRFIILLFSVTLMADITLQNALKSIPIGTHSKERIVLGTEQDIDQSQPTQNPSKSINNPKLQQCYKDADETIQRAIRSNKHNDPSKNISLVTLDASPKCSQEYKECAKKAWQRGHRCFESGKNTRTCHIISGRGAIRCALQETACSAKVMYQNCLKKYGNSSKVKAKSTQNSKTILVIDPVPPQNTNKEDQEENIRYYQNEIEKIKDQIDRVRARLKAEIDQGVDDQYHQRRIRNYQNEIKSLQNRLPRLIQQLHSLGAREKRHTKADNSDVYDDVKHNNDIYHHIQKERAKQAEIQKIHKIIDRFGSDYETQRVTHKRVDNLAKGADIEKIKRVKGAIKEQFYDSRQSGLQADATYQSERAKELGRRGDYVKSIRDTAVNVNKGLSMLAGGELGELSETISTIHSLSNNAIDAGSKDGFKGVVVSLFKDIINDKTLNIGGDLFEKGYHLKEYYTTGLNLPNNIKLYDKDGNRLRHIKKGDKIYNSKGERVGFSFERRLWSYKLWTERARSDILNGDINRKSSAIMDTIDNGGKLGDMLWDFGKHLSH